MCHYKTVFLPDQTCDPKTTCVFSRHITLGPNLELCQLVYGISPDDVYRSVQFSNTYYGSDQPKSSRIVFVNGETGFNDNTSSRFATVFLVSLVIFNLTYKTSQIITTTKNLNMQHIVIRDILILYSYYESFTIALYGLPFT